MTNNGKITGFLNSPLRAGGKTYKNSDFETERIPFEVSRHHKNDLIFSRIKDYGLRIKGLKNQTFLLKIPDNKIIKNPIILKYKPTKKNLRFALIIEVGKNSEAVVLEDMSGMVESKIAISFQLLAISANSKYKHIRIQNTSAKTNIIEKREFEVGENARSEFIDFHFGGESISQSVLQKALKPGAAVSTDVIGKSGKNQEFEFNCKHEHAAKNTGGQILIKGVATDKAKITSKGSVFIGRKGGGTESMMRQEALNLGSGSVIQSIPELKIDTSDVKASHSSSVRNLNDEELYYLNSRGLDGESSRKMLMTGFLKEELDKIRDVPGAYEWVKRLI